MKAKVQWRTAIAMSAMMMAWSSNGAAQSLPPVPEFIAKQNTLRVGVRCDQPPYGFQDSNGEFAGVETDMARQLAQWIHGDKNKVTLSCVTAENRIPQLNGKRVDVLIATLGVTPERQRVIDFSKPYRWGASGLLVHADSSIQKIKDLNGKTVAMPKGSVQAKWFEDNAPEVTTLRLNTAADSLQALKQKRAEGYAHDEATLVVIAAKDPSLRIVNDPYQLSDAAIGVRKNEEQWRDYLSAAVDRMHAEKLFGGWVAKWVPENIRGYYIKVFETKRPDRQ